LRGRRKQTVAQQDQPWSATVGHSTHTLGNPVLIFCAMAAWSVALILIIGVVVPGPDKLGLAIAFIGVAALGALPAWVVRRRRQRDKAWAIELRTTNVGNHGHRPDPVAPAASDEAS
jgi:Flp pilus assembly protein TadB